MPILWLKSAWNDIFLHFLEELLLAFCWGVTVVWWQISMFLQETGSCCNSTAHGQNCPRLHIWLESRLHVNIQLQSEHCRVATGYEIFLLFFILFPTRWSDLFTKTSPSWWWCVVNIVASHCMPLLWHCVCHLEKGSCCNSSVHCQLFPKFDMSLPFL